MSTINTSGINVNYPVPGVNNSSQGFRDNFAAIKNNINLASNEITDLQNKVVLKSALENTTLNNDMANALISNAATRSFRATTYNLGNSLSGTVFVDVSLGDVQFGTVAGDLTLQFGGWAPSGTQSNLQLQLAISNSLAVVNFPSEINANMCYGVSTLENYDSTTNSVSIPAGVCQLDYRLSTIDCGTSITIEPYNRPRRTTEIRQRSPAPTGLLGDQPGTVSVSSGITQLVITGANTDPYLTTTGSTAELYTDMPIVFTGISLAGNIVVGNTYYVRNVVSSTTFTMSSTVGGANVAIGANTTGTTMFANPASYLYVCTNDYDSATYTKTISNTTTTTNVITMNNTTSLVVNAPIIFSGTAFGGLSTDTVYYIKTIASPNITVSLSRFNGVAGTTFALTTANNDGGNIGFTGTTYVGSDIWKRITLNSW